MYKWYLSSEWLYFNRFHGTRCTRIECVYVKWWTLINVNFLISHLSFGFIAVRSIQWPRPYIMYASCFRLLFLCALHLVCSYNSWNCNVFFPPLSLFFFLMWNILLVANSKNVLNVPFIFFLCNCLSFHISLLEFTD